MVLSHTAKWHIMRRASKVLAYILMAFRGSRGKGEANRAFGRMEDGGGWTIAHNSLWGGVSRLYVLIFCLHTLFFSKLYINERGEKK